MTTHDDPFERAARREAMFHRVRTMNGSRPLIGLQSAWGVILALHWWLSGGEGRVLTIHTTVFVIGLAFTVFAAVSMRGGTVAGVLGITLGWGVLLALHWLRAGGRTPFVTVHTVVFGLWLATAILAITATPRGVRRGPG
jgi:hypothetical protein